MRPLVTDVTLALLRDLRKAGGDVMFEGAQGSMLDIDHGTYPYVTSSNTTRRRADRHRRRPARSTTCSAS